jgi:hypothetical protein
MPTEYFVVFIDYGPSQIGGSHLEAVVESALTRSQIVSRIKTREYDNIVQIDHIHSGIVTDATTELIDEAEAELAEPFGDDMALPAAVIPPVR